MSSIKDLCIEAMRDNDVFDNMISHIKDINILLIELAQEGHIDVVMKLYQRDDVHVNTLLRLLAYTISNEDFLSISYDIVERIRDMENISMYTPVISTIRKKILRVVDEIEGRSIPIDEEYMV